MTKEELIARGKHAERLLADEVLRGAIDDATADRNETMIVDDRPEIRDACREQILSLRTLIGVLEEYVKDAVFIEKAN